MHNLKKNKNKFKKKKQPELTKNQTVWKSNNQGAKETFTQTGRRGGDGQPGGEDSQQGGGSQTGQSHVCMRINQEGQLGSETDHASHGLQDGERKPESL